MATTSLGTSALNGKLFEKMNRLAARRCHSNWRGSAALADVGASAKVEIAATTIMKFQHRSDQLEKADAANHVSFIAEQVVGETGAYLAPVFSSVIR